MILPPAPWLRQASLVHLVDALGAHEGMTRYVGGVVRDTLLDLPAIDIDVATALAPDEVIRRLSAERIKVVPTGLAHGTVTAVLPEGPVEVTTLRRDIETDGRHARVAFTDDWREDAARRDFTINALFADPTNLEVIDYFGGLSDLEAGLVRFIGDPLRRIAEDHLRILRFFRFHARFGRSAPDGDGLAACTARANDLMALSRERIAQELLKLLAVADPVPTIGLMVAQGIFRPVLPEIEPDGVERLARLVAREGAALTDPIRRLAALLPADPAVADSVGARLRLSNAQRKRLVLAAQPEPIEPARPLAHRIGIEGARDRWLLAGSEADWREALAMLADWHPPRLPIGGGELVALGLTAGPRVAATLKAIERQWVAEDFPDEARVREIARDAVAQALRERM